MFAYISIHIRLLAVAIMMLIASNATAQVDGAVRVNPEDRDVDLDDPTFVPMVRVGKVFQGRDSIEYVELNNIYISKACFQERKTAYGLQPFGI